MIRFEINDHVTPLINGMQRSVGTIMQELVEEMAEGLTVYEKEQAPVGQHFSFDGTMQEGGQLRDSLHFVIGQWGAYLAGAKQGEYVIGGTRAHEIRPRAKKYLAFFWPKAGAGVIYGKVNHPGTKPNDFRWKAVEQAFDENVPQDIAARIMADWIATNEV